MRSASAAIVLVGLADPAVTKTLPSMTPRLAMSWAMPKRSTTDVAGSSPMRAVPMRWPLGIGYVASVSTAPAARSDSAARSAMKSSMRRLFSESR